MWERCQWCNTHQGTPFDESKPCSDCQDLIVKLSITAETLKTIMELIDKRADRKVEQAIDDHYETYHRDHSYD